MVNIRNFMALSATLFLSGCLSGGSGSGSSGPHEGLQGSVTVETVSGAIRGETAGNMLRFLGVPYAQPPLGSNRFKPPKLPTSWSQARDATEYGASCPQTPSRITNNPSTASSTEDCLFLNVFAPNTPGEFPVMVWMHGGAFVTGSGANRYNPARLVERGVVVVTVNYRLGMLGWLSHPDLTAEGEGSSGNYGLMDQQAALRWVQSNIANFGGDPNNVTLFGESAGGHSVLTHLVAPDSAGLFHKAIIQSGSYFPDQKTLAEAETLGLAFERAAGCDTAYDPLDCMRNLPVEELLAAQDSLSLGIGLIPTTTTDSLPLSIRNGINAGTFSVVPTMLGFTQDEGRYFVGGTGLAGLPEEEYEMAIGGLLGISSPPNQVTAAIANQYPLSSYETPAYALSAVFSDAVFVCNALDQSMKLVDSPLFGYEFADVTAPPIIPVVEGFDFAAAHAFELTYLFGDDAFLQALGFTDSQRMLSATMLGYWTNFARNGDPNPEAGDAVFWPDLATSGQFVRFIPNGVQVQSVSNIANAHHCGFWSKF